VREYVTDDAKAKVTQQSFFHKALSQETAEIELQKLTVIYFT